MSSLNSSNIMSAADLRATSIDKLRAKKRRVRYRNTNMGLVGVSLDDTCGKEPEEPYYNDHNKWKMSNFVCRDDCCVPVHPSRHNAKKVWSRQIHSAYDYDANFQESSYFNDKLDKDIVEGVTYSFDRPTGPSHGSQILSHAIGAAINKMENKQLEKLVKDEYEVVETDDSASSDDDFELV